MSGYGKSWLLNLEQRTSSKRLLKLHGVLKRCDYNLISQDDCVTASLCVHASDQGPVVLSLISANPRLNYNPGFFIPMFKSLFGIFSCFFYGASNHRLIDKKNYAEFSFKLSDVKSDLTLILGYLNPAENNRGYRV